MSYKPPIPTNVVKDKVYAFAEQVSSKLSLEPGDPLEPLVSRLGGRIEFKNALDFQSRLPESIVVEPTRRFTIFLSSMTSGTRDRFTIAHELGHYFLHFPVVAAQHPGAGMIATRWVDNDDPVQRRAEWEANWFAAGFLMPSSSFKSLYSKRAGSIAALASDFGVSTQVTEIRAKSLGLF